MEKQQRSSKTKPILVKDGKLFGDEQGYKINDVIPDSRLSPIPTHSNHKNRHVEIIEIEDFSKKSVDTSEIYGPNYKIETNRNFINEE